MAQHLAVLVAAALLLGGAVAPPRPAHAAPGPQASTDLDKAAFEALSPDERRAVQEALVWVGGFSGTASGVYGPRTKEALAAFRSRASLPASAPFDAGLRARLAKAADQARREVGFAVATEARTGLRIGLPMKLLPRQVGTASGVRYSGPDGALDLDLVSRPAGEGGLADTFARMSATGPGRSVEYKLLKPEFFVVSGDVGERKFYARFEAGLVADVATVRGFTITYPKDAAKTLDPVALAVAGSLVAFPDAVGLGVATKNPLARVSGAAVAEALVVAPGRVLVRLSQAECTMPSVGGAPATWRGHDPSSGLAVLDAPHVEGVPVSFGSTPLASGDEVTAFFADDGQDKPAIVTASAEVRAGSAPDRELSVTLPLPVGGGGAFLFDRTGALAGMTKPSHRKPVVVAGIALAQPYGVLDALDLTKAVRETGLDPAAFKPGPPELPAPLGLPLTVVTCGGRASAP